MAAMIQQKQKENIITGLVIKEAGSDIRYLEKNIPITEMCMKFYGELDNLGYR